MKSKNVQQLLGISRACCAISVELCGCFSFQELKKRKEKKSFCFFKCSGTTWHVTSEVFSTVLQKMS